MRAAVVGDNTIDRYLGTSSTQYVGGNAVNVAVQLSSRAGGIGYFGAIGADPDGDTIRRVLTRTTLDLGGLVTADGASAVTEIRLTSSGDRVFEREHFGVTAQYYPDAVAIERMASARWVHIGMLPRSAELIEELAERNPMLPISQDCSVSTGHRALQVAFDSAGEDPARAAQLAQNALANGAALAVVTLGSLGAIASDASTRWQQDAHPAHVIDTTGAGDSFAAGFIDARLNGRSVQDALAAGSRWAAQACEHLAGFAQ
ncbi:MAG: sugar kinase [Microbacteriaceae bacterium]|nr:MAG: sugar kinase [Microbacteriaceae bacterium]